MKKIIFILFLINSFLCFSQSQGPLNGGTFSNVAIGGSSASWNTTSNASSSNNSYSISSTDLSSNGNYTDYLKVTNFGFSIPASSNIDGIVVEIEYFDNGASDKASDNRVRIVKGGTIGSTDKSAGGKWPGTDPNSYDTYGSNSNLWGETWTETDINSSTFGFAISGNRQGGGGTTCYPAIDHIRITVYYSSALPIELLSFEGENHDKTNLLKWTTASEINNDFFTLEKSKDGINFTVLAIVDGYGTSAFNLDYSFVDNNPYNQTYYRLKQTDFDGEYTYSEIVGIDSKTNSFFTFNVFPNPNMGSEINAQISAIKGQEILVVVNDFFGKETYSKIIIVEQSGEAVYAIDPSEKLSAGIYIITATSNNKIYTKKLVVR